MPEPTWQPTLWGGEWQSPSKNPWSLDGRPQTVRKLRILATYLRDYIPIMLRFFPRVYYIDCFAGRGWYDSMDGEHDGSPVIAARLAHRYRRIRQFGMAPLPDSQSNVVCRNIEISRGRWRQLQKRTAEFKTDVDIDNIHGNFREVLPRVLSEVEGNPAFVLVDPYGIKDAKLEHIADILKHPSEVLINFSYMGVARCAAFLDTLRTADPSSARYKQASENVGLVDDLFGTTKWQAVVLGRESAVRKEERLIELYGTQLRWHRKYVIWRRLPSARSSSTLYYLVFATNNEIGLEKFSDACFKVLKQPFQSAPQDDFMDPFLLRRYAGERVEWGRCMVDLGERFRSSWIRRGLNRLAEIDAILVERGDDRAGRRNPGYDFSGVPRTSS